MKLKMNISYIIITIFILNLVDVGLSKSVLTALVENLFSSSVKDAVNHTIVYGHSESPERSRLSLPRVWLTVSSTVDVDHNSTDYRNTSVVRALEIHWQATHYGPKVGDKIEVYDLKRDKNNRIINDEPIRKFILRDNKHRLMSNYIKTDIEFPYLNETELDFLVETGRQEPYETKHGNLSGRCLHFYSVYISSNQTLQSVYCISLNSRWMENDFHLMQNRSLTELIIPGTHDSASFEPYEIANYEGNVLTRFLFTQDESIYSQLAYGIRYLDMRVGAYNMSNKNHSDNNRNEDENENNSGNGTLHNTNLTEKGNKQMKIEELWTVHDYQRNNINLREALQQIRNFIEKTTHEIIIVDFHRFVNGFDSFWELESVNQRLRHFYSLIVEHLGPYIVPFAQNPNATIGDMVRLNRRIIIGYAFKFDPKGYFDSDLFWPATEHLWAKTDKLGALKSYMKREICSKKSTNRSRGHMRSMMAELTPSIDGFLFSRYKGLRSLATLVNSHYDLWFRRKYWTCANVVAADFFSRL